MQIICRLRSKCEHRGKNYNAGVRTAGAVLSKGLQCTDCDTVYCHRDCFNQHKVLSLCDKALVDACDRWPLQRLQEQATIDKACQAAKRQKVEQQQQQVVALSHNWLFNPVAYHQHLQENAQQLALQHLATQQAERAGALDISSVVVLKDVLTKLSQSPHQVQQIVQAVGSNTQETSWSGAIGEPISIAMNQHLQQCMSAQPTNTALYMHNSSLIDHIGSDLFNQLYDQIAGLSDDITHKYSQLYATGANTTSADTLVGSVGSYSNFHQDGPLRCASWLVVLKGRKLVVMFPQCDKADKETFLKARCTLEHLQDGELQHRVMELGGRVIEIGPNKALQVYPQWWHAVCNMEPSVSINLSHCSMKDTMAILKRSSDNFNSQASISFGEGLLLWATDYTEQLQPGDVTAKEWKELLLGGKLVKMCGKNIKKKAAITFKQLAKQVVV